LTRAADNYKNTAPHRARKEGGVCINTGRHKKSSPDTPLVSIITVVVNGEKTLEQTIKSVLHQTYHNIEYIIIDGGSTDRTLDIISKYDNKIDYWLSEPDNGIYDAMNKGIKNSKGVLINLLNADDYLELTSVSAIVSTYLEHSRPSIIYGRVFAVDEYYSVKSELYSSLKYWLGMSVNHQSMFVHKDIYNTVGLYNSEEYKYAADYDFLVRNFKRNVLFLHERGCVVNYRNKGISYTHTGYRKEARLIHNKIFGRFTRKHLEFILFNYLWTPIKYKLRTFLYYTIGIKTSRKIISLYKKALLKSGE
jgi:glycosyltransferase involved in cell wall biosynthesis